MPSVSESKGSIMLRSSKHVGLTATSLAALVAILLASCATLPTASTARTSGGASRSPASPQGARATAGEAASLTAAQLQAEFSGVGPHKSAVIIGTRDITIAVDGQGRTTTRYQFIFKVMTPAGVDDWSQISVDWEPWHELRPEIEARVLEPDGKILHLNPATLIEGSADDPSSETFSDSRRLRGPLPGMRVGSIVDEEVTVREFQPGLPGGTGGNFYLDADATILTDRFVVEVPASTSFRSKVYLAPKLKAQITRTAGMVRYLFEAHDVPPAARPEEFLPYSNPHWPHVSFSTGKDWNALAVAYNRYVEAAIHSTSFAKEAGELRGKDLQATLRNIQAWMNARVRYTGLYFGNHSIIPTNPRVVLARGFGDCKDKAVLMAAILRADGWDAHLALLLADEETDADPSLPTLGQFNHAIIYIPGTKPTWVDATEEYADPSVLPLMDQGRYALIIDPSTTGLVRIPVSPAKRNTITDTREFFLTDSGFTDVKEELRYTGSAEEQARADYDGTTPADERKTWSRYVNAEYRFGELKSLTAGNPRDLSKPFAIDLVIGKAGRGYTGRSLAQAAIATDSLSDWLPDILSERERAPRKGDFIFAQPIVETIRYIIHPPLGFTAEPLPRDDEEHLGTMSLSVSYSLLADKAVEADLSLDSGNRRLTPAEFEATRKALTAYLKRDLVIINFDLDGATLMAQGKYGRAFASYRRLIAADPRRPIQLIRYSRALLEAGLQEKARAVIRAAVKEAPKSAESFVTLGYVLEHDRAGRLHGPFYDRTGAIAAYQRAIELDPSDSDYKIDLAHIYELNADGVRYGPGSDMAKAVALFEQLRNTDSWNREQPHYWNALLWARDWAKLREVAQTISSDQKRDYYLTLCDFFQRGLDAALARSAAIYPDETRRTVLAQAALTLLKLRRYPESKELLQVATDGIPRPKDTKLLLALLAKAKRVDAYRFDANDPAGLVQGFFATLLRTEPGHFSRLKSMMTPTLFDLSTAPGAKGSFDYNIASVRDEERSSGIFASVLLDLALPALRLKVAGTPETGYRVKITSAKGTFGLDLNASDVYLIRTAGGLKMAATSDVPVSIGVQVLDFLQEGRTSAADQWLDWAMASAKKPAEKGADPLAEPPAQWFWGPNRKNALLAAASLLAYGEGSYARRAYETLLQARSGTSGMVRDRIDEALVSAYLNSPGREGESLPFAEELNRDLPNSDIAFGLYHASLIAAGRGTEAGKLDREWLARHPKVKNAMVLAVTNIPAQLSPAQLDSLLEQRIHDHTVTSVDYNERAWAALFFPPVPQRMLEEARRAVSLTHSKDRAELNTLAALYAARGNCQQAYKTLLKDLKLSGHLAIQPEDWYVLGLIAEHCGVPRAAIAYYKRVTDPHHGLLDPAGPYALAQERLAVLEGAARR